MVCMCLKTTPVCVSGGGGVDEVLQEILTPLGSYLQARLLWGGLLSQELSDALRHR
jgi:hypothetical protein